MSKTAKAASVPGVAAKAAKEATSSVVTIGVLVLLAIFVVIPLLPSLGDAAVRSAGGAATDAAERLGDAVCPAGVTCLGNGNRTYGPRTTTAPTTAAPKPYGPPNGPIRPLRSQLPPPDPLGNLPALGQSGGGGPASQIPAIGPIIEGGVKAIGPGGLKAIGK